MAHVHLYRVAELARFLVSEGCRVVVHVDAKTPDAEFTALAADLADTEVALAPRHVCEWGMYSLHEAGLETARYMMERFEDVNHVSLISGSCLPIRPIAELRDHLSRHPDSDFVESRLLGQDDWVQNGLSDERFTLYFPFSWQRQRWLFDRFVDLQRRLRIRRRIPQHLDLALGSQWWTLTRETLRRILDDPLKDETDSFFRKCWIVDEAYVQTLARRHSRDLRSESLCLTEFDPQGKPFTFYDDHAHLLTGSDKFFARKVWHGASGLYNKYLYGVDPLAIARRPRRETLADVIDIGRTKRCVGRPGLLNQSRFPVQAFEQQHATARPYLVLDGFDELYVDIARWQNAQGLDLAHGRVFRPEQVEFAANQRVLPGGMIANPKIRDWNSPQFLTNLIWHQRDRQQSFLFHVSDSTRMASFILKDPNAQVLFIEGAWMLGAAMSPAEQPSEFRRRVMRLKLLEAKHKAEIESASTRATVHRWSLRDIMSNPAKPLETLAALIEDRGQAGLGALPALRAEHGMDELVYRLESEGVETGLRRGSRRRSSTMRSNSA
ncbi:beta-1,6-N-acetylglucosaminyltransferase [Roseobacter sp. HKCCA0434]|uniref:DUF5927 domain-containing protein n=1 Tax=Roseobacter sp. HKCCA0434 TaxID=3079297 RepID=UPI002905D37A|nr:beta-1,6-N-acetylglucosaminyltransferase [Roseobacter sp. HKCCA0434]